MIQVNDLFVENERNYQDIESDIPGKAASDDKAAEFDNKAEQFDSS